MAVRCRCYACVIHRDGSEMSIAFMASDLTSVINSDAFVPLYDDASLSTYSTGYDMMFERPRGEDGNATVWTNWGTGEPGTHTINTRRCVYVDDTTEKWHVVTCTDYNAFACEVHAYSK